MSKRKTLKKIDVCSELTVGQRVAIVERNVHGYPRVQIAYVDSHSVDQEMIYADFRWRNNRGDGMWMSTGHDKRGRLWDLVFPYENQVEIYVTNMKLHQVCAAMQKRHPDWKWIRGVL